MKKLQGIPNTIMNISVLEQFDNLYISDSVKTAYLLIDWETFNSLPALQQVRGAIKAFQTSMTVLLGKMVSNFNLKTLTNLAKRFILDAWLGPGRASVD